MPSSVCTTIKVCVSRNLGTNALVEKMNETNVPRNVATTTYLLAAVATICYFVAANSSRSMESTPSIRAVLLALWFLGPPLVFASSYARMMLDPVITKKQTILAAIVNFSAMVGVVVHLWFFRAPGLPYSDPPFTFMLIIILGVPITFLLTSLSIFRNRRFRYIFGTIAAAIVWPFTVLLALGIAIDRWDDPQTALILFVGFASPLLFAFAAGAMFRKTRAGYITGLAAGCVTLSVLAYSELRLRNFKLQNSWIAFNLPAHDNFGFILVSKLKILSVGLAVIAVVVSAFRLIPSHYTFRKLPLNMRTWPALAVCLAVLTTWFCYAVVPYRIPVAVDGFGGDSLRVLRVKKDGMQFHEISLHVGRHGTFYVVRDDRRLFQYQFQQYRGSGVLPPDLDQKVSSFIRSPQLQQTSSRRGPLRKWHAEGWYVLASGTTGIQTYTSELGTVPPQDLIDLFDEIETQKVELRPSATLRDVCLGFCYDPPAGLGFIYENSRCFTDMTGTHCQ